MSEMVIRPGQPSERALLRELVLRSKRAWGYDDAFMTAAGADLDLAPEALEGGRVLVALDGGTLLGMASWGAPDAGGTAELTHLFVEPAAFGRGVGRLLFEAAARQAGAAGCKRLRVVADPNAGPFYERLGGRPAGQEPSSVAPGRMLPVYAFDLG